MGYRFDNHKSIRKLAGQRASDLHREAGHMNILLDYVAHLEWQVNSLTLRIEILKNAKEETCPNGLTPDGDTCPRCGCARGPSGVDGGSWVHLR